MVYEQCGVLFIYILLSTQKYKVSRNVQIVFTPIFYFTNRNILQYDRLIRKTVGPDQNNFSADSQRQI